MSRPPVLTTKKLVSFDPAMLSAVEDYRFANRIKTEAEAIRRLIELGLQAAKKPKK